MFSLKLIIPLALSFILVVDPMFVILVTLVVASPPLPWLPWIPAPPRASHRGGRVLQRVSSWGGRWLDGAEMEGVALPTVKLMLVSDVGISASTYLFDVAIIFGKNLI
jgi:hypothetical protein